MLSKFITNFHVLAIIVFDKEPHILAVDRYSSIPKTVKSTDVFVAVAARDDNAISVTSSILI